MPVLIGLLKKVVVKEKKRRRVMMVMVAVTRPRKSHGNGRFVFLGR